MTTESSGSATLLHLRHLTTVRQDITALATGKRLVRVAGMNVLIIGGTGLISTGIVKHLQKRGADISMFNRGKRENTLDGPVGVFTGDRNDPAVLEQCVAGGRKWDVVIDMICFTPEQATGAIRTFAGKCEHFIFCSTVCTYGTKVPPGVVIDETFPQEPISGYGKNKVACENLFTAAHGRGDFACTIIRPSHTYGEGSPLIDQLEPDAIAWDRIARGQPVLCAGDGIGLWNSTHRDDVGKLFAFAALNSKTYGQSYNATTERVFTWRDYYREAADALGTTAQVLPMPAEWIIGHDPKRFGLLREITQFHGPYTSAKARRDVPEFDVEIDFRSGAQRTLADVKRRGAWRDSSADAMYQGMIDKAVALGVRPLDL
ncbi:MAG: NAD-dependent epimerase/dehydratase family protein [Burkholderiales bacterium]|nr:NAD-dependent epimerase/dehydratase family protein [Phycisphaerae bacterium]